MYNAIYQGGVAFIPQGRREGEKESTREAYSRVQKDIEKI
jgi:hypothetical protein